MVVQRVHSPHSHSSPPPPRPWTPSSKSPLKASQFGENSPYICPISASQRALPDSQPPLFLLGDPKSRWTRDLGKERVSFSGGRHVLDSRRGFVRSNQVLFVGGGSFVVRFGLLMAFFVVVLMVVFVVFFSFSFLCSGKIRRPWRAPCWSPSRPPSATCCRAGIMQPLQVSSWLEKKRIFFFLP